MKNWTIGYQRELWRDAALEIRYVGNRGSNLWRGYNINETNIFENGFLQRVQERAAQPRDQPRQRPHRLRQQRPAGTGRRCRSSTRRSARAAASRRSRRQRLHQRHVHHAAAAGTGRAAGEHAAPGRLPLPLSRWSATPCPACASRGYNAPAPYPINVFQANPFGAGANMRHADRRIQVRSTTRCSCSSASAIAAASA